MLNILLATKNQGKILEYKEIFNGFNLPFRFLTLKDLGISAEPEEDGKTFEENAIKKAKFYSQFTEFPILADDSGLEIDYLNGEPGILSRRWPGYEASDEELIRMTLQKLEGVPREKRGAQLRVSIVLYDAKEDNANRIHSFEGILRGYIMEEPIETRISGYPFRTIFYVSEIGRVLGELTMEEEAKIAHRRKAIEKAIPIIKKILYR